MKITVMLLVLALSGCQSVPAGSHQSIVQRALDRLLPPTFTGDIDLSENIPMYISITIKGHNLWLDDGFWKYTWLEYDRNGPVGTSAHIRLGKRP